MKRQWKGRLSQVFHLLFQFQNERLNLLLKQASKQVTLLHNQRSFARFFGDSRVARHYVAGIAFLAVTPARRISKSDRISLCLLLAGVALQAANYQKH